MPKDILVEFLAFRLPLDRLAAKQALAEKLGFTGSRNQLPDYAWDCVETS
ncbi:MAG: hypothetical protein R3C09_18910 [Pirellulaceae bacterium]